MAAQAVWALLREYAADGSPHSVRYLDPKRCSAAARLCWVVSLAACAATASLLVAAAWGRYSDAPTVTQVADTDFPLHRVPFPAVTICPPVSAFQSAGEALLARHIGVTEINSTLRRQLSVIMSAICHIQYPYYHRIQHALDEAGSAIELFEDLNITWLMLQALPPVEEVFKECFWQGHYFDCSSLFFLQRTEIGFCYAFNSLTSENRRHCGGEPRLTSTGRDPCLVWRNVAAGPISGLELFLRRPPTSRGHHDDNHYRLMINAVSSVPNTLRSQLISPSIHHVTMVDLDVSVTESSPQIKTLPIEKRQCFFPNERHLILNPYSQVACAMECRLKYMLQVCNCTTYFFNKIPGYNMCKLADLSCISSIGWDLRFHRPGDNINSGSKFIDGSINCSLCLPTCCRYEYTLDIYTEEQKYINLTGPYVDIHYTKNSAIKYERILAFTTTELIVSFGGIMSLFLGVSVLSCVEVFYYFARLCLAIWKITSKKYFRTLQCAQRGQVRHIKETKVVKPQHLRKIHSWYP